MKNAKRKSKAERQPVVEELNEVAKITIDKRKLLECIRTTASFCSKYEHNSLRSIKIDVCRDKLKMYATDGNRAIETIIDIEDTKIENISILIWSYLLTGLCFNVSNGDFINLEIDHKQIVFDDPSNGTKYVLQNSYNQFPDIAKVMDEYKYGDNEYKILFNRAFMENMKRLHVDERTNIVVAKFNKADNLKPIIFETQDKHEGIKQRAVLMPIQERP